MEDDSVQDLSGVIDLHIHSYPEISLKVPNAASDEDWLAEAQARGIRSVCLKSHYWPTFALGIPGSAVTALFIAALTMHGLQPGVQFYTASGALPYAVQAGILLAQFSFFILGLLLAGFFARLVLIPNSLLVPIIVFLCFVGTYAIRNSVEDILVTIFFGFLGYFFHKKKYPTICLVLGLVLGDITESNFHRALIIGRGSYSIFLQSTISLVLFIMTAISLTGPYIAKIVIKIWSVFKN